MSRIPVSRRSLLGSIATVGLVGTGASASLSDRIGEAESLGAPDLSAIDQTATGWADRSVWESSGMATELSLQVMYPGDTLLSMHALRTQDALDRVDVETAATNAARLQDRATGGVYSFGGDFLGPWTRSTYGAIQLSNQTGIDIDRDAAAAFLSAMQRKSGGFAPRLDFFGIDPINVTMSATDRALWGLRHLSALDATTRNKAESYLQQKQTPQGGWPWFGDTVEPSTLGTYHALRALDAIDADTQRNRDKAATYLKSLQADGGGFYAGDSPISCNPGNNDEPQGGIILSGTKGDREKDPDPWTCLTYDQVVTTYSTSRAILGLARTGHLDDVDNLQQHADWLAERQFADAADPRFNGGFDAREGDTLFLFPRSTTRLALRAFAVLEEHGVEPSVDVDLDAAVDFLIACQHDATGGFGAWPSYVQSLPATASATRALADLDASVPGASLADTLAATQQTTYADDAQQDGAIPPQGWEYETFTTQTAAGLLALDAVDQTSAVNVGAAARVIASRQNSKTGGFTERPTSDADGYVKTSGLAARALAAVGETDQIDTKKLQKFFGDKKDRNSGHIGPGVTDYGTVADTSLAVRALAATGEADQARYLEAAVSSLANVPAEGGEYWPSPAIAGQAVLGLAAVDELDRIDTDATREYIERSQFDTGGYAARRFYIQYTALSRHAAAVSGLTVLGGSPRNSLESAGGTGYEYDANATQSAGVARLAPGRGMLNHRAVLMDPADLEG